MAIAQHSSNETIYWQDQQRMHNLTQVGQDEMSIKIDFELNTEQEVQETGVNEISLQVTYTTGNQTEFGCSGPIKELLYRQKPQQGLGAIEYIPSTRTYQEGQVLLQNVDQNYQGSLDRRVSDNHDKYHDAKQKYVNFAVHDKLLPNEPQIFPEMKTLIETLLERVTKVDFDNNTLTPMIKIKSLEGWVDIDSLSSGQRGLFLTYVSIMSLKLTNSIILFDEPDLHLHAILQRKVLQHLLQISESGNQFLSLPMH